MTRTLRQPPLDANGIVTQHDHSDIIADECVVRGITVHHIKNGRITSAAFKSSSDPYKGLSVDLSELIKDKTKFRGQSFKGAVEIIVEKPRSKDMLVGYDPLSTNNAHCQIWARENRKISNSQAKFLKENVEWFEQIDGILLT